MDTNAVVLSTSYFPPIQYFSKLVNYSKILIDIHETYSKQSYRNRCVILSSNGPLSLTVPVIRPNGNHTLIKDTRVDYSTNWQKNHWKAIESAYRNSIYFDFVADCITPFFERHENFLVDLNLKTVLELLNFLGISRKIDITDSYIHQYPLIVDDFRKQIHPKSRFQRDDPSFTTKPYYQVFSSKFGFTANLSMLDLLFNEGLSSVDYL